jgi:hypothetical protein
MGSGPSSFKFSLCPCSLRVQHGAPAATRPCDDPWGLIHRMRERQRVVIGRATSSWPVPGITQRVFPAMARWSIDPARESLVPIGAGCRSAGAPVKGGQRRITIGSRALAPTTTLRSARDRRVKWPCAVTSLLVV